ncbi:MAG TPA: DNA-processing protein DprA [Spirochaetota bacterium]|nr:DNA-processing protein DprA [Spirochaetota bacterium]
MSDYKYWMALEQSSGMGPAHCATVATALESRSLSLADIFMLEAADLKAEFPFNETIVKGLAGARAILDRVEQDYLRLMEGGAETVLFFEPSYPPRLRDRIAGAFPPILYAHGNRALLKDPAIAILGDKDVSDKGGVIAHHASAELVRRRFAIISGLARGVGQIAHRAAAESGGETIAVLPYGMFHLAIPDLLQEVYDPDRFLILSPFYPTTPFTTFNAFTRNRMICALSDAVYIVESPVEGGIFEAGKSARKIGVPLFTTEYAEYPKSAAGNKALIDELGAIPVRGRLKDNVLQPNLDRLIGAAKFPSPAK